MKPFLALTTLCTVTMIRSPGCIWFSTWDCLSYCDSLTVTHESWLFMHESSDEPAPGLSVCCDQWPWKDSFIVEFRVRSTITTEAHTVHVGWKEEHTHCVQWECKWITSLCATSHLQCLPWVKSIVLRQRCSHRKTQHLRGGVIQIHSTPHLLLTLWFLIHFVFMFVI